MFFLGYDLGSSSVKVCLLDGDSGCGVAHACYPDREMTIEAPKPGWAEQAPETWWECAKRATERLLEGTDIAARDIGAVGISYQMHGLVLLDRDGRVVRPSIIWCDSRAVEVGARAFEAIGESRCLEALLNAPGNFTASKLAWVRENEPANFERAHTMMLPGEYLFTADAGVGAGQKRPPRLSYSTCSGPGGSRFANWANGLNGLRASWVD